ncbi:MAG TPA: DNA polymerase/3'-5' exonuclease PolX, partial [Bacteroidetes bacterium]|nr:DNA polymerase/3'-5' exonuclease PolX [Bacteroidota bacterium]
MTNREIAKKFDLLAKLMELHDDNPFKIRSFRNAYNILRQTGTPLIELNYDELVEIPGIGKAIASKIIELRDTGSFSALEKMLEKTPPGILDLLKLKGLGPKKIKLIWQQLGVESLGELEYAIKENRLTLLKGFGKKTQDNILKQIEFLVSVKGSFLFHKILPIASKLLDKLKYQFSGYSFELTGDLRRYFPIVTGIDILTDIPFDKIFKETPDYFDIKDGDIYFNEIKVQFVRNIENSFSKDLLISTGPKLFVDNFNNFEGESEQEIFLNNKLPYIPPVYRDNEVIIDNPSEFNELKYIQQQDIKGVIHNHTVWSDGSNSVEELAMYCKEKGYDYLVVTDHSKSAFYANGLNLDRIEYYL